MVIKCEQCETLVVCKNSSRRFCDNCNRIKNNKLSNKYHHNNPASEKTKKARREYYENNREQINENTKKWQREHRSVVNERFYKWVNDNREAYNFKRKIRLKTERLLKKKGMATYNQTCEICGKVSDNIHHNDYSNPYDISWLCSTCHQRLHRYYPNNFNINPAT